MHSMGGFILIISVFFRACQKLFLGRVILVGSSPVVTVVLLLDEDS